jgi:YVTN family beta-propeller protein
MLSSLPRVGMSWSVLLGAMLVAGCNRSSTPPQDAQTPRPPAASPAAPPLVYVSDETGSRIVVVNGRSGQTAHEIDRRIDVGKRPRGLRLLPDGTRLLVALSGSPIAGPGVDESKLPPADRAADGIGVVDVSSGAVIRKYQSGQDPESFALSVDGRTAYISNEETAEMSVLDLQSGTITHRVKIGEEPEGVTMRPDGRVVYVTCEGTNEVFAVDTATLTVVARVAAGARPRSIEFDSGGTAGFITNENDATVTVFDAARHKVTTSIQIPRPDGAPTPARPMGLALARDGRHLFVSLGRARGVAVIDVAARSVVRTIPDVGTRPWGIGVSPDGRTLYTANGPSGDVSFVDIESGRTEKRVAVGGSPWGIAVGGGR